MAIPVYINAHRADHQRPVAHLVDIAIVGDQTYYLTDYDAPIKFPASDPHTYTPGDGVELSAIRSNEDTLAECGVSILNAFDNEWGSLASGFFGENRTPIVTIREVWVNTATNPATVLATSGEEAQMILCSGVATAPEWSLDKLSFNVVNGQTGRARKLPFRQYSTSCPYRLFKGFQCQYQGADTACTRTLADCTTKGNSHRFGGFTSMPDPDGKYYFQNELIDLGRL